LHAFNVGIKAFFSTHITDYEPVKVCNLAIGIDDVLGDYSVLGVFNNGLLVLGLEFSNVKVQTRLSSFFADDFSVNGENSAVFEDLEFVIDGVDGEGNSRE